MGYHQNCDLVLLAHVEDILENDSLGFLVDLSSWLIEQQNLFISLQECICQIQKLLLSDR